MWLQTHDCAARGQGSRASHMRALLEVHVRAAKHTPTLTIAKVASSPWDEMKNQAGHHTMLVRATFNDGTSVNIAATDPQAALVFNALNSHDAMVTALTICKDTLPHIGGNAMSVHALLATIDAALSTARGES